MLIYTVICIWVLSINVVLYELAEMNSKQVTNFLKPYLCLTPAVVIVIEVRFQTGSRKWMDCIRLCHDAVFL